MSKQNVREVVAPPSVTEATRSGRMNRPMSLAEQLRARPDVMVNHEGGIAFKMPANLKLLTKCFASLMNEKTFYTDAATGNQELFQAVHEAAQENPELVLKIAAYGRDKMNMRSTPIAILAEAASIPACKPFVRQYTSAILRRADEPAELMAYWIHRHGQIGARGEKGGEHAFPNSLKRGIEDVLHSFDEYEYAKYDRDGGVKMRDVFKIVRPKPQNEQEQALFAYIVKGELNEARLPLIAAKKKLMQKETLDEEALSLADQAHATWEVLSSKFGRKKETWDAIAQHLPIMASIRNLGNILESGSEAAVERVLSQLRDPKAVANSRQLPYRFFSAFKALDQRGGEMNPHRSEARDALQAALQFSTDNLPHLPGTTFITTDNSGSMQSPVSGKSTVTFQEVGNLLGAMAHRMCDRAIVSVFGEGHQVVDVSRMDGVLTNMNKLNTTDVGHSTNAYLTIRHLLEKRVQVDRIIIFSDMQCYDSAGGDYSYGGSLAEEVARYRSTVNPDVHVISVDLAGHGTSQFPMDDKNLTMLAGWSDRVLALIAMKERGAESILVDVTKHTPRKRRARKTSPSAIAAQSVATEEDGGTEDADVSEETEVTE